MSEAVRTLADLGPLRAAEQALVDGCVAGRVVRLGDARPEASGDAVTVRAAVIRVMALGGDAAHPTHERGVALDGAWVEGALDLAFAPLRGALQLTHCMIPERVCLEGASAGALSFVGSDVGGIDADDVRIAGAVVLGQGCMMRGGVALVNATIDGWLDARGGTFEGHDGVAIRARGARVSGDVILGQGFVAHGAVDLTGVRVGGDLDCTRAAFSAEHGAAFEGRSMQVDQIFTWRDVTVDTGDVVLTQARVGGLADDVGPRDKADSWPGDGRLKMDGFVYDRITYGDTSAKRRLVWVDKHSSTDFQPQPHQQLARIVGEMGHRFDRGRVLIALEHRLRAQTRKDMAAGGARYAPAVRWVRNAFRMSLHRMWSTLLDWLVGFGYRPQRAFYWGLGLILLTGLFSQFVWDAGDFAPSAGPILASGAWQAVATSGVENAAAEWSAVGAAGQDYETFRAWIYAVDVVVPLVNLGQDAAWAPSTSRGVAGIVLHEVEWIVRLAGWVIAALGAGAVAGVIRQD